MSRWGTSVTKRGCRLLCPDGCGLQRIAEIDPASFAGDPLQTTWVRLRCGHERGEFLPARPGSISVERMNTHIGKLVFPSGPYRMRKADEEKHG